MGTKTCEICAADISSLKKSPTTCVDENTATERTCGECWEAHLSYQVEELDPRNVECMFCASKIDRDNLKRLARKDTLERFDYKLLETSRRLCQNRCFASNNEYQSHDRKTEGRVFACGFCKFETCIDCDRPEHNGETCEEYRTRVVFAPQHARAEAATRAKFKTCPSCETIFEMEKGCGATQCEACKYRFCSRCMIPWVGESSAYLAGREAHFEGCLYRTRDTDSKHGLKRRFEPDAERKQRLEAHEETKRQKREAKKLVASGDDADLE